MKKILFVASIICSFAIYTTSLNAQTIISYSYDTAGNRTHRLIVKSFSTSKANVDTTKNEKKKEILENAQETKKIRIYPNPTNGQLFVEIVGCENETKMGLSIYNLKGTVLLYNKILVNGNNPLDISGYSNGTYILKVTIGDKESNWKILKD
jgi:hypothetical protein